MKNLSKTVELIHSAAEELSAEDQKLVKAAHQALGGSYSPYSNFAVGASLRLKSGEMIKGANQENAAYPSGLCAERVALFYAGAHFPNQSIDAIAVLVSGSEEQFAYPCGACLQVIAEYQDRQEQPIDIILAHTSGAEVLVSKGVDNLLPFAFKKKHLKK